MFTSAPAPLKIIPFPFSFGEGARRADEAEREKKALSEII